VCDSGVADNAEYVVSKDGPLKESCARAPSLPIIFFVTSFGTRVVCMGRDSDAEDVFSLAERTTIR
jgi:hypothetical protein